jgi:hypothetical protein
VGGILRLCGAKGGVIFPFFPMLSMSMCSGEANQTASCEEELVLGKLEELAPWNLKLEEINICA